MFNRAHIKYVHSLAALILMLSFVFVSCSKSELDDISAQQTSIELQDTKASSDDFGIGDNGGDDDQDKDSTRGGIGDNGGDDDQDKEDEIGDNGGDDDQDKDDRRSKFAVTSRK